MLGWGKKAGALARTTLPRLGKLFGEGLCSCGVPWLLVVAVGDVALTVDERLQHRFICPPCLCFGCLVWRALRRTCMHTHHSPSTAGETRVSRGGAKYLSTINGTTSASATKVETYTSIGVVLGVVVAACVATATAVHRLDQERMQGEIKRIQGERTEEVKRIQGERTEEVKRIQGERTLAEQMWKNEIDHYKREVQLHYTHDYEPFQKAQEKNRDKMMKKKGKKKEEGESEDKT